MATPAPTRAAPILHHPRGDAHLDDRHAVFGPVVEGQDVVVKIGDARIHGDRPNSPLKMVKVSLVGLSSRNRRGGRARRGARTGAVVIVALASCRWGPIEDFGLTDELPEAARARRGPRGRSAVEQAVEEGADRRSWPGCRGRRSVSRTFSVRVLRTGASGCGRSPGACGTSSESSMRPRARMRLRSSLSRPRDGPSRRCGCRPSAGRQDEAAP